jgi:shikimate kinase
MRDMDQNIVIIGFASTGKSTTGRALARALGRTFVDLDDIVERLHVEARGHPRRCRDIVHLFGRDCFVGYEREALASLTPDAGQVIATGGGTPMEATNREMTERLGLVVYLKAAPEVIFERMAAKGFPYYLGEEPTAAALQAVWEKRHPVYAAMADITVDNAGRSPEESARAIIEALVPRDASSSVRRRTNAP